MKELVSAVSHAMANRLKAPILGSFILAWLAINYAELLTFFYNEPKAKLMLLQQETTWFMWSWSAPILMKVVYPFLAAILYTFALPALQFSIDSYKFRFIEFKRIREKHRSDRAVYRSLKEVSRIKAQSNPDYWTDKLNRDLDKWDEQRKNYRTDLKSLREQIGNLNGQVEDTLKQSDEWHKSYLDSQKALESQSIELESLRAAANDEVHKREQLEQEFNKRSLEMEKLLATNTELTENSERLQSTQDALSELKNRTLTSEGVLDLIANLDAEEHIKLNNRYFDNAPFRKQIFESSIQDPEFLMEVVNNKYVAGRIAHELRLGTSPVGDSLANMGYVVTEDSSKLSLAKAAAGIKLPVVNE